MEHTKKEMEYLKKKNKAVVEPVSHPEYGMKKHEDALQKMKKMGYDCDLEGSILMIYTDEEVSRPPVFYIYPDVPIKKKKKKSTEEEFPEVQLTPAEERYNKIKADLESTGYDCSWGIRKKRTERKENLTGRYRNSQ